MGEGTGETLSMRASFTVELEQHVGWTYQPVLMEGVEFDPVAILENLRSSNQGDVVVVDNIKRFLKDLFDSRSLQDRPAGLMGQERREKPQRACQRMHGYIGMVPRRCRWFWSAHNIISIFAMNHLDLMTARCQLVGQLLHKHGIPTKMVRRIESSDHAEA